MHQPNQFEITNDDVYNRQELKGKNITTKYMYFLYIKYVLNTIRVHNLIKGCIVMLPTLNCIYYVPNSETHIIAH